MTNNSPDGPVALRAVAAYCGHGDCPTVYRTDRDTFVVQGYHVEPTTAGIEIPNGERLVEIPVELVTQLIDAMSSTP